MRKKLFTIIGLIVFFSSLSYASPAPQARPNIIDFLYRGEYFFTESNLSDDFGDIDDLPSGQKYSNFSNLLEAGYSFSQDLRISGGAIFAFAQSDGFTESRSNSQLNTLLLSSQYDLRMGRFRMTPDIRILFNLEEVERNTDDVMTSEGASAYEFGSWFSYPIWRLRPYGKLAYRFVDDDRSSVLAYSLGVKWPFSTWWIGSEVRGTTTVADDAHADFPAYREIVTSRVNGGSLRYYSVNPEYLEVELLGGLKFENGVGFAGGVAQTVTGQNTAYGTTVIVQLTYDYQMGEDAGSEFDEPRADRTRKRPRSKKSSDKPSDYFEPILEDYDESLFSTD